MQKSIVWAGLEYESLEHCRIKKCPDENSVRSTLAGMYDGKMYSLNYQLEINRSWEIRSARLDFTLQNEEHHYHLVLETNGSWLLNGNSAAGFNHCTDIDISLSPFTNTLPVNRLKMMEKESRVIRVIYFDLLENRLAAVSQKYTRLSGHDYRFENIPNNFESVITFDEYGFVVEYPRLFTRKATL